ncbi:FxSxx-COOH system tetratricopeptide repeat protein [Streptosporangium sp. KLBMP 9127]|nr:FxSxx-COOH system tetratricopeptide repeat protein [Streptosporangium sp. KLBMP 9127]
MGDVSPVPTPATVIAWHSRRDGVGRTTTLCNVALLLAADGHRVLVFDAAPGTPSALSYLDGFLPAGAVPGDGPAGAVRLDLGMRGSVDVARPAAEGDEDPARLRAELAAYDYVMLDGPAAGGREFVAAVADTVVLCYSMSPRSVEEAAAEIVLLHEAAAAHPVIVPLAMRVDLAGGSGLEQARTLARTRFGALRPGLEIPYRAEYSVSETLAVLREPPGWAGGLRDSCERLAGVLTEGRVTPLRRVSIVHAPRRRAWAEWLAAQSTRYGTRADLVTQDRLGSLPPATGHRILVLSPGDLDEPSLRRLDRLTGAVVVKVGAADPGGHGTPGTPGGKAAETPGRSDRATVGLSGHEVLDLTGLSEEDAFGALRSTLGAGPVPVPWRAGTARFPGVPPAVVALPSRERPFLGRDPVLDGLRAVLGPNNSGRAVLTGSGGIGKTQAALEYATRFLPAYDLVWWLDGSGADAIGTGLVLLAERLRLPPGGDPLSAVQAHLVSGQVPRWLLICDDVTDASAVADLIPIPAQESACTGHVLATTRESGLLAGFRPIELGPMDVAEAAGLLRTRAPWVTGPAATAVVETTGRLPLAVDLAGAWLARELGESGAARGSATADSGDDTVTAFTTLFARAPRAHAGTPRDDSQIYGVMVELALQKLIAGAAGRAGPWLVEACAFLSPRGIGLALLRSPPMIREIERAQQAGEAATIEPTLIDAAVREAAGYALIQAELGRPTHPVRMHRAIQDVLRGRMRRAQTFDTRRTSVSRALAAWAPRYFEGMDESARAAMVELDRHLEPSGNIVSPASPQVRHWVLDQLRFLLSAGHRSAFERAGRLAEQAYELTGKPDSEWALNPGTVREELLMVMARMHLRLGDGRKVVELSEAAMPGLTRELGTRHPMVLEGTGVHAAGLRATGEFELAHDRSDAALQGLRALFGANHPQTGRAMNNYAVSAALMGHLGDALRVAEDRFRRRTDLYGKDDRHAWGTACNIAYYLRELGELDRSRELLKEAVQRLTYLERSSGIELPMAQLGLAITDRRLGRLVTLLDRDRQTHAALTAGYGPANIVTMSCAVSLDADHYALREFHEAAEGGRRTLADFEREMGPDHPFAHICRMNLGVYLRAAGDPAAAAGHGERAMTALLDRLGPLHPLSLAATANHAGTLARLDRRVEALTLEQQALGGLNTLFGPEHPNTLTVAANIQITQSGDENLRKAIDVEIPSY